VVNLWLTSRPHRLACPAIRCRLRFLTDRRRREAGAARLEGLAIYSLAPKFC
jgi:hypothetical protein